MASSRDQMERTFAASIFSNLKRWLAKARFGVMLPWNEHRVLPNAISVQAQKGFWTDLVRQLIPQLRAIAAGGVAEVPGAPSGSMQGIEDAIGASVRLMSNIPDEVQGMIQETIRKKILAGADHQAIADAIDNYLTDETYWQGRAMTIARTEVNRLANYGQLAAGVGLERLTGNPYTKEWEHRDDSRVRPEHEETGGQRVPLASYFDVGGVKMMCPLDHTAPAWQVVNCRCSMKIRPAGGTP